MTPAPGPPSTFGAMVEPRFRKFLISMITWLDDTPNIPQHQIRAHIQDCLTQELAPSTPKRQHSPEPTTPSARARHTYTSSPYTPKRGTPIGAPPPPRASNQHLHQASAATPPQMVHIRYGPLEQAPPETNRTTVISCLNIFSRHSRMHAAHNGLHPQLLSTAIQCSKLSPELLEPAHHAITNSPSMEITIYCGCNHGRHRSVACAQILHILLDHESIARTMQTDFDHTNHEHDHQHCPMCTGHPTDQDLSALHKKWAKIQQEYREQHHSA